MRLFLVLSILTLGLSSANADIKTNKILGYIQSDKDIIKFTQLDVSCEKDGLKLKTYQSFVEIHTKRVFHNMYELIVTPIKLFTPLTHKLDKCQVVLIIYIEPKTILRFRIMGSTAKMTSEELEKMVGNYKIDATLTHKLSAMTLVRAQNRQGYSLILAN